MTARWVLLPMIVLIGCKQRDAAPEDPKPDFVVPTPDEIRPAPTSSAIPTSPSRTRSKNCSFQTFIGQFPLRPTVATSFIPDSMLATHKLRSKNGEGVECVSSVLSATIPNFNTETTDMAFGRFNFPDFQEGGYQPILRMRFDFGWAVVFSVYNCWSFYVGMATFGRAGDFKDQVLVAGREGWSERAYVISSEFKSPSYLVVRLDDYSWVGQSSLPATRLTESRSLRIDEGGVFTPQTR